MTCCFNASQPRGWSGVRASPLSAIELKLLNLPLRSGDVAVITGGARGVGASVVTKLLQCDMHVVIGCRDVKAGQKLIEGLRVSGVTSGSAECFPLDMTSHASVRMFAESVLQKCPKIHVLINNAGIMFVPFSLTEDGFESHFAVNYLSHCLLTHLLLPRLKASSMGRYTNCRVVNVSSCAHMAGTIYFDDFNMKESYLPSAAYAQSKLAQILFTRALERRLRRETAPVQAHAVHPGVVNTDIFNGTFFKRVFPWVIRLFFKSQDEGALPVLYAAVSTELEGKGGTYISNCRVTQTGDLADSEELQEKLWTAMLMAGKLCDKPSVGSHCQPSMYIQSHKERRVSSCYVVPLQQAGSNK
uniref:(California timema) hypothetical protein n=1 Tax=Timema californicum TaxID=61474 RepID=A0A7R9IX28_TIMCA|nr:unnamed protein product [Timema californicum]